MILFRLPLLRHGEFVTLPSKLLCEEPWCLSLFLAPGRPTDKVFGFATILLLTLLLKLLLIFLSCPFKHLMQLGLEQSQADLSGFLRLY